MSEHIQHGRGSNLRSLACMSHTLSLSHDAPQYIVCLGWTIHRLIDLLYNYIETFPHSQEFSAPTSIDHRINLPWPNHDMFGNSAPSVKGSNFLSSANSPSKSTSPTSLNLLIFSSQIRLIPTSITAAPSLIISALIRPGIPVATTTMSAVLRNTRSWSGGV